MCYAKPGPRCASHINKKLQQISDKLKQTNNSDEVKSLKSERDSLKKDYLLTPQGIKQLEEKAYQEGVDSKAYKLMNECKQKREHLIALSKENSLYQKSTIETFDDMDYTSQVEALSRIKLPKGNEKFQPIALFLTGSRLYNTHHDASDYDYVMIYTDQNALGHRKHYNKKHSIVQDDDIQRLSFDGFISSLEKGSPNALEMLNSQVRTWGESPSYKPFLNSLKPNYTKAYKSQREQIRNYSKDEAKLEKSTRHMFRVALNSAKMLKTGYFNPTHTQKELDYLNSMTDKYKNYSPEKKYEIAVQQMDRRYEP